MHAWEGKRGIGGREERISTSGESIERLLADAARREKET